MKDVEARNLEMFLSLATREFTNFTLRDYFAAHAPDLPGKYQKAIIGTYPDAPSQQDRPIYESDSACIARWRYEYADAMIEARKK